MTEDDVQFRDMESNVVARFSKAFESRFIATGSESIAGWANTTLGKQDTEFADHLLAANARFAIIEFKANLGAIETEANKVRRKNLFKALAVRRDLLRRCLDMHMICWGSIETRQPAGFDRPIFEELDMLGHYAAMVAPHTKIELKLPKSPPMSTEKFLDKFLCSRTVGGTYRRFKKYLNELGEIAGGASGDSTTIQGMVCVYIPGDGKSPARYAHARFRGIKELQLLLKPRELVRDGPQKNSRQHDRDYHSDRDSGPTFGR